MKAILSRVLLSLLCIMLCAVLFACKNHPSQNGGNDRTTALQTVDSVVADEPNDTRNNVTSESATKAEEPGIDVESNTDNTAEADPVFPDETEAESSTETTGITTDTPKDPNQGDWDPQP